MRKTPIVVLVIFMILSVLLTGCKKSDENQVLDTIRQYVKYTNAENAGEVYILAHQQVRTLGYKNELDTQFAIYDIETKMEKLEFVKIEDDVAYVDFVATMIKKDQSDFKDLRITGTFALQKENDTWKILGMAYDPEKDVEYLNP